MSDLRPRHTRMHSAHHGRIWLTHVSAMLDLHGVTMSHTWMSGTHARLRGVWTGLHHVGCHHICRRSSLVDYSCVGRPRPFWVCLGRVSHFCWRMTIFSIQVIPVSQCRSCAKSRWSTDSLLHICDSYVNSERVCWG